MNRYKAVAIFGPNIVASEGEEWKKYRKIAAPAFSEVCPEWRSLPNPEYHWQRNNRLVWDETILIMMDMFDNVWGDSSEIAVNHCLDITLPVRLPWLRFTQVLTSSPDHPFRYRRRRQVIPHFNLDSLMRVDTRIRASGHMDK